MRQQAERRGTRMVCNLSLTAAKSNAMNEAIRRTVQAGVAVVAAAGNDGADACTKSPASAEDSLTIAAMTRSSFRSAFSSVGSCVNIFAPGSNIMSATSNSWFPYGWKSGTSMASPFVAGVVALYWDRDPSLLVEQVRNQLKQDSVANLVLFAGAPSSNFVVSTQALNTGGGIISNDNCGTFLSLCASSDDCCGGCVLGFCFF